MQLAGKAALISGAGGGICRAIAVAYAKAGAAVACCDLDPDASAETARLVTEAGGSALSQACDVASEAATRIGAIQELHIPVSSEFGGYARDHSSTADLNLSSLRALPDYG